MAKHISETPATEWLKQNKVAYTEHPYDYVEHGGTAESSKQLGIPEHHVIKTLVMQNEQGKGLVVLMHGNCKTSTKNLARQIGCKTVEPCKPEVAQKLIGRIHWWENYTEINGGEMNNNPSPGNKAGGLTTILEKSLGAVAKGGTSNLQAVYEYAEPVDAHGFVYMDTPGYDPVSATGQVAGGANLICFTTGRGSAYGCAPSPSLKFSTNTALWKKQEEDMDLNCGEIVDNGVSVADMGQRIFDMILKAASGEPTKSEQHGYGQNEFVPWQVGAVM